MDSWLPEISISWGGAWRSSRCWHFKLHINMAYLCTFYTQIHKMNIFTEVNVIFFRVRVGDPATAASNLKLCHSKWKFISFWLRATDEGKDRRGMVSEKTILCWFRCSIGRVLISGLELYLSIPKSPAGISISLTLCQWQELSIVATFIGVVLTILDFFFGVCL